MCWRAGRSAGCPAGTRTAATMPIMIEILPHGFAVGLQDRVLNHRSRTGSGRRSILVRRRTMDCMTRGGRRRGSDVGHSDTPDAHTRRRGRRAARRRADAACSPARGTPSTRPRTGRHADLLLRDEDYDLVVLDVGLPDIDGFEVLRRLRARRSPTSVLVLTARDAVEDRVHGLDLGADDYLTKPFSVTEFEARVRALLRRNAPPRRALVGRPADGRRRGQARARPRQAGRPHAARVGVAGALPVAPGPRAQQGADRRKPVHVRRAAFAERDRGHVSRLRTKIEPAGVHIRTVRGFGYLWEGGDE